MAPNMFATMLHRKTNRITLILVYAVLEWALIFFLLLNSLFSYLIIKFAHYFGLKTPCLLCSRLDHILEPQNPKPFYRELVCEQHGIELSRSGYCYSHQKLVESRDMCVDCRWPNEAEMAKSDDDCLVVENGDVSLVCSCCRVTINNSSEVLEDTQKAKRDEVHDHSDFDHEPDQNRIEKLGVKDQDGGFLMGPDSDDNSEGFSFWLPSPKGDYSMEEADEEEESEVLRSEKKALFKNSNAFTKVSYAIETVLPQHVEFYIDLDDYQLVPVDLVNLETKKSEDESHVDGEKEQRHWIQDKSIQMRRGTDEEMKLDESMVEDLPTEGGQELEIKRESNVEVELYETGMQDSSSQRSCEEEIKREVVDVVALNTNKIEMLPTIEGEEEVTRREVDFHVADDQSHGSVPAISVGHQVTENTELNEPNAKIPAAETDETKVEDLPTHQGQELDMKREIVVEVEFDETKMKQVPNETSGDEEMEKEVEEAAVLDANKVEILPIIQGQAGSVSQETILDESDANELDSIDEVATFEELKSVLKSERKALSALYAELEEERNAAAVATNQTMLMISRLQKEKAAIEMEALQYQRMMEEQSEYDQEALQLMNEILVKREKQLQEVEKEFERYRKKVIEYEEREKMRLLNQGKSRSFKKGRNSSTSCSNGEESDGLSVDLSSESRDEENGYDEDTPVDAILDLEDTFEEERVSILEQLKVLEEKLCALAKEEEHGNHNLKPFEQLNGNCKFNGDSNGRMNGQKPKQLLPLFDAAELESDDEELIGIKDESEPVVMTPDSQTAKFESENKKLAIEEEVDHMYERLHGLEADREFLKHCIGSLSKGDRGLNLLQEIVQHLRDLKSVELQARNVYGLC